jgi:hypothetical protein
MLTATDLIAGLRRAGVRVIEDPSTPTCSTQLTASGYVVRLGRLYSEADEEGRRVLVAHELGHIVRGDCLVDTAALAREHGIAQQDAAKVANMAADSQINAGLPGEVVQRLGGVTYDVLRSELTELPAHLPGWRPVADALLRRAREGCGCPGSGSCHEHGGMCRIEHADPSDEAAQDAHASTILRIRTDEALAREAERIAGQMPGLPRALPSYAPRPIPTIERVLRAVRLSVGRAGIRQHARTWARPGRVPLLRGSALLPRGRVCVAVDVSGSVQPVAGELLGQGSWLKRRYDVAACTFDVRVYPWKGTPTVTGGGTSFRPVYQWAERERADVLVMVTDGYADDIEPLPPMPVVWVLTPDGRAPRLRAGDRLIMESKA